MIAVSETIACGEIMFGNTNLLPINSLYNFDLFVEFLICPKAIKAFFEYFL